MNEDRAVYSEEEGKWYRQGDTPWRIRVLGKGDVVKPSVSALAYTYAEAFASLFGYPVITPQIVRSVRRVEEA